MRPTITKVIAFVGLLAGLAVFVFGFQIGNRSETAVGLNTAVPRLSVTFFDVGQGDSALIETPQHFQILVDGGPDKTIAAKLGQTLPFYDQDLDLVILTHPHSDHVSGLVEVLRRYQVKRVIMTGVVHTAPDYLEFLRLIKEQNLPVTVIDRPQDFIPEKGISLSFLWPQHSLAETKPANQNDSSLAFTLNYGSTTMMFTGDLEQEEQLVSSTFPLKSQVYKVGHHGSTNANSQAFLQAVAPDNAIISVGADNDYGHPHYRVVYGLQNLGAKIWRTDRDGDIICQSDSQSVQCHSDAN